MKKLTNIFLALIAVTYLVSCDELEESRPIYKGDAQIEIEATTLNTVTTGRTYPILTKVPGFGRPVITADPNLTRASGTIKLRVNLITAQRSTAETLTYKVVDTENLGGTNTTVTTAQANVHYTTSGTFTIPANSSFGEIEIQILNPGASSGSRDLVLELVGNANVKATPNYNKIGLRIAQN